MKNTPFTEKHIALGAKMAPFAGYNMPISYAGINEEHLTVRKSAGVFDVSHMGEFIIKGDKALDLIQYATTNDASKLKKGKIQYSVMPNDNGGIVDDLLVYCLEENKVYMLVVNAANIEKDWNRLNELNKNFNAELINISDKTCLLAVQGPEATRLLQKHTEMDLLNMPYYSFDKGVFAGVENVLISATGYTGAGGVEIYFEDKEGHADKIWDLILNEGIKPIGLGARDTLRLEMGYCLYGNDINDDTSPIEAGLGWVTKFTKDFPSKAIFEKQKAEGVKRKLVGFELVERGISRKDYPIVNAAGEKIGVVTSGTQLPGIQKSVGMGYVQTEYSALGSEIFISIREKPVKAVVVKMPFS